MTRRNHDAMRRECDNIVTRYEILPLGAHPQHPDLRLGSVAELLAEMLAEGVGGDNLVAVDEETDNGITTIIACYRNCTGRYVVAAVVVPSDPSDPNHPARTEIAWHPEWFRDREHAQNRYRDVVRTLLGRESHV